MGERCFRSSRMQQRYNSDDRERDLKPAVHFTDKLDILEREKEPAGVVSPKISRILLEKGAVSRVDKKFEPIVNQDPTTIRKYLGQSFRVHRLLPSTHAHGESDEKKRQAGANKYRAQKIAFNTHARGDSGLVGDALIQTDRQSTR
ncbi:hypothetical protein AVEN_267322-1 [Araneus ventricosus]|uniref:Uncharacterized protein n=1 Tax=Araneus ventricosus TaxID=182803 RepID=A0A4Y2DJP2_ARAVE|nr:hypothetical protein AVEN_267322-1 [Araneus ventricosus]